MQENKEENKNLLSKLKKLISLREEEILVLEELENIISKTNNYSFKDNGIEILYNTFDNTNPSKSIKEILIGIDKLLSEEKYDLLENLSNVVQEFYLKEEQF